MIRDVVEKTARPRTSPLGGGITPALVHADASDHDDDLARGKPRLSVHGMHGLEGAVLPET